jgi:hypothetical protein
MLGQRMIEAAQALSFEICDSQRFARNWLDLPNRPVKRLQPSCSRTWVR